MKNLSSEKYTAMKLLSHLMTDAYSLSTSTLYHFFANKFASINQAVFTHHHAGHENQIAKFIFEFIKIKQFVLYENILKIQYIFFLLLVIGAFSPKP